MCNIWIFVEKAICLNHLRSRIKTKAITVMYRKLVKMYKTGLTIGSYAVTVE